MSDQPTNEKLPQETEEAKVKLVKEMMQKREQERKEQLVAVVMRQTDYDEPKARMKLEEHKYDVSKTILEYMKPDHEKANSHEETDSNNKGNKSANQLIYGEFRKLLDDASKNHRIEKEREEKRVRYIQMLQQQRDAAANSLKKKTE